MLWPELQLSLQRDFARAVMTEDDTMRQLLGSGRQGPRKVWGVVPHDLGSPSEEPWTKVNVYNFQDVSRWKDLGPKFVLQVLRDYRVSGSVAFATTVFPTVLHVMNTASQYDTDKDGLIENQGFPDQTYDIWTVTGPSAYTGGLWLAAMSATVHLAEDLLKRDSLDEAGAADARGAVERYSAELAKGKARYEELLWNGRYFN